MSFIDSMASQRAARNNQKYKRPGRGFKASSTMPSINSQVRDADRKEYQLSDESRHHLDFLKGPRFILAGINFEISVVIRSLARNIHKNR